jgi:hypothetical protein
MSRRDWSEILRHAAAIVSSYDTGVTLRQLFYRLVSDGTLRNTQSEYGQLSSKTAKARREGGFPPLVDNTRTLYRPTSFDSPAEATRWLSRIYRRDRTEGQEHHIFIGVEKDGMVALLKRWFNEYGVRIMALRGYSSQTFVDKVVKATRDDGRPAVLIYGGDHDPSGEDIQRDFAERTNCFDEIIRIALTPEQVVEHNLPEFPGKAADARAGTFVKKHGKLVQVELDALPPDVLKDCYMDAFMSFFNPDAYEESMSLENMETDEVIAVGWTG